MCSCMELLYERIMFHVVIIFPISSFVFVFLFILQIYQIILILVDMKHTECIAIGIEHVECVFSLCSSYLIL